MSEQELRDSIIRQSLQLQRLSAGDAREVEKILRELERELKLLLRSKNISEATKAELRALITEASKLIDPAYARAATAVDTHGLAVIVAEKTAAAMTESLGVAALAATPERLASLTKDVLIEGSPLSSWWKAQADNLAEQFARQVRLGSIAGETIEQIVRRIAGSRTQKGVMDIARRHARTLVHSSVMGAANEARLATYRKNSRFVKGVRFLATLDSNTCLRCAAMDGAAWDLEGKPIEGTDVAFTVPGLHANCRCVLSVIPKDFRDLGFDIDEPGVGTRASSEGPIAASTTFEDFLKRNRGAAEKVLGRRRLELFMAGKLNLRDLISGSGRELTLDELAEII